MITFLLIGCLFVYIAMTLLLCAWGILDESLRIMSWTTSLGGRSEDIMVTVLLYFSSGLESVVGWHLCLKCVVSTMDCDFV